MGGETHRLVVVERVNLAPLGIGIEWLGIGE